ELVPEDNVWNILQAKLSQKGFSSLQDRYPVLCSGSNANPAQIQHKFTDADFDVTVPMIRGNLHGAAAVFAGHVSVYGAIPATMERVVPCDQQVFVAFYTDAQLDRMIETENDNYWLARSGDVRCEIPAIRTPFHPYAFISKGGVLTFGTGDPIELHTCSQGEIIRGIFSRLDGRINGTIGKFDYHAYFENPLVYREQLERAITDAGFTRPPAIPWENLSREDVAPFHRCI
ncbi:MAG TPA: hypothetical protein VKA68_18920, partial [bacterium]|nr:hypothetical protein [bacterium]